MPTLGRLLLIALALVAVPCLTRAQPQARAPQPYTDSTTLPDTPAYKRALEVLAIVNTGDPEKVKAYIADAFAPPFRDGMPIENHLGAFAQTHADSRKLEVYGGRSYTPPRPATQAVLVVRNTLAESWQAIVVEVEEADPHKITSLMFSGARPPSGLPKAAKLSDEQIADQLKAYIQRLTEADAFSGAVLFAKDGKIIFSAATGIANRDFNAPNRVDTKFNLGSMNKMFTAVAALQLVEAGKLALDDKIGKYLGPDWVAQDILDQVQVQHLLTHTSGLGSYFNDQFDRSSRALYRRVDDYKTLVHDEKLAFSPGTQWKYSNTGMLLAGAVIEKASGQDYFAYIRNQVTGPAGMTSTDSFELDRVNPNLAVGYEKETTSEGTEYHNNLFMHVMKGGPAGGGYSTVEDLLRFDQALRSGKLLSKASLEKLWSAHPELSSPDYGFGFGVQAGPAGKVVGHSGGFTGISAHLSMYLDTGHTVAVLSNYGGAAELVNAKAAELLTQGR